MRVILFTGKGGVGKTSVAASTALACARRGYRTLVMSTDPAHSLGDALDRDLGPHAQAIEANLWAHEVSALHEMERNWGRLHEYLARVLSTQGLDDIVAEEVATPPGMDEVASLMWIKHYAERGEHDVVVVDCAPTGETLQLLMFPDAAKWWLDKIYPWERRALRVARPLLRPVLDIPLPEEEVMASVRDLLLDLEGMKRVLTDTSVTSMRLVLNLEKMVIKEAKRAYTYLSLFGYETDCVVVNRRYPPGLQDPLFRRWYDIQSGYAQEVDQSFAPLPILNIPLFDDEVVGVAMLARMAEAVYGSTDPAARLHTGKQQQVRRVGKEYVLAMPVPFAERGAVDLSRQDGELFVTVGNYKRDITLPRTLASRETVGAALEDGELRIRFGPAGGREGSS
ncbi:MAG: ArsA family ATPase [Candidatus Dormibacteraceae bacterium]